jgi:hypothetical protein
MMDPVVDREGNTFERVKIEVNEITILLLLLK